MIIFIKQQHALSRDRQDYECAMLIIFRFKCLLKSFYFYYYLNITYSLKMIEIQLPNK